MRIKRKILKVRIRIFIKIIGILHTSRCIARKKETPLRYTFLMVRNLSDFGFCCRLSVAYLCAKCGWNYSAFGGGFRLGLLLHGGLF